MDPMVDKNLAGVNGRPRLGIDMIELEKLCAMQCTQPEIAAWFCCAQTLIEQRIADRETLYEVPLEVGKKNSEETVRLTFQEVMQRGYSRGKISFRRHQIQMLEAGSATMGVWLGKQYLGQKDIVIHANPDGSPIEGSPVNIVIDRLVMLLERRREGASHSGPPQVIDGVAGERNPVELAKLGAPETT